MAYSIGVPRARGNRSRRMMAGAGVLALAAGLAGCGLASGATGFDTRTLGDPSKRGGETLRYAFARGRVPIVVEGQVTPQRKHYALTVSLTVGAPKYAVDAAVAVRVTPRPRDGFRVAVDPRHLLAAVEPADAEGKPIQAAATRAGIEDFPALLAKSMPALPSSGKLQRISPVKVEPFRLEKEVDPAVPEEVEAFERELAQTARDWDLKLTFEAETADVIVGGRRLALARAATPTCDSPVCFRVPIPYRVALAPMSTGWRGKAEARVWLPNEGPLGSLDVRSRAFVAGDVRATFDNGVLKSLTSGEVGVAEGLLQIPVATAALP